MTTKLKDLESRLASLEREVRELRTVFVRLHLIPLMVRKIMNQ